MRLARAWLTVSLLLALLASKSPEVVLPLIYALHRLPGIHLTVYKDAFREGSVGLLQKWGQRELRPYEEFFSSASNFSNVRNTDVVLLSTADRSVESFVTRLDVLNDFGHLKFVAVAHRTHHWNWNATHPDSAPNERPISNTALSTVLDLVQQRRWSFLTLSPHVRAGLKDALAEVSVQTAHTTTPDVHDFVPVSDTRCSTHMPVRKTG